MSYFSHNPEAWDEIEVKGILTHLMSYYCGDDIDREATEDNLKCILTEIQCPSQKYPKDFKLWDALRDWAHDSIIGSEQDYWEHFVR